MGGPEYARYVGIKSLEPVGVFLPGCPDSNYPGGTPFDPLGYSADASGYVEQQVGFKASQLQAFRARKRMYNMAR